MSNRYAPLPNPRTDRDALNEMDAAFDDSDDEGDDDESESRPLNPSSRSAPHSPTRIPGTYDFENADYDYPPPGSPPGPSAIALPNEHGNSNGVVPSFAVDSSLAMAARSSRGWFSRTAASVLPSHYIQRLTGGAPRTRGVVGGGTNNDGVFANVTAKPAPPRRVQEGNETYLVPEDAQADVPPSYASAQADSVPPYWETTVHAPFSPNAFGEMIIDNLPTGSVFSFLWNMLVSISFQFIGFLLTYLLHTTHAARLGSRAGLGVTLIQYGFALRSRMNEALSDAGSGEGEEASGIASGYKMLRRAMGDAGGYVNGTSPDSYEDGSIVFADATTEWLSFFLMTVGWFILLTSVLGFLRVKRWERGILASQAENTPVTTEQRAHNAAFISQFESMFGLRGISRGDFLRQGLGLGVSRGIEVDAQAEAEAGRAATGQVHGEVDEEAQALISSDPRIARVIADDINLRRGLQEAGFI